MARGKKKESALTPEEKLAQTLVPVEEQPYKVPTNWCWTRLSNVKSSADGFFDGDWILSENMDPDGDVRLLQLSDIGIGEFLDKSNKHISLITHKKLGCTELHPGDVMISRMAEPIARSCIVPAFPYTVITAVDVAVIRCNCKLINNEFLNYLCNTKWFTDMAYSMARGTTRVRITRQNLGGMPVPIPPLTEQQRIVDRIEYLFTKLDEAKEKAQSVLDSFEARKAAILHKAFTGELTAKWRAEHGLSVESWRQESLANVCTLRSGTTIPSEEELAAGLIPYVKVSDMNLPENAIQITTSSRFVNTSPESHLIPYGSTIFPKRGGAILTNKKRFVGVLQIIADLNTMAIIPIESKLDGWYGYYWMQSIDLRELNNGSNVPQINNKDMVKLTVPTPLVEEQKEIVRILDSLFAKEQQAKEAAEAVLEKIDLLKKSILARAFRGELGTNDVGEESALELLKSVL